MKYSENSLPLVFVPAKRGEDSIYECLNCNKQYKIHSVYFYGKSHRERIISDFICQHCGHRATIKAHVAFSLSSETGIREKSKHTNFNDLF